MVGNDKSLDSTEEKFENFPQPREIEEIASPTDAEKQVEKDMKKHTAIGVLEPVSLSATASQDSCISFADSLSQEELEKSGKENLAVATAITDEGYLDGGYLPSATEYDPDSKPSLLANRRFRMYSCLGCNLILLLAILLTVVTIVVPSKGPEIIVFSSAPTPAPTPAPTSDKDAQYRFIFSREVGNVVYEVGTAHHMAADWIINKDPLQLKPDADNLIQRFTVAFLYFHFTNGTTSEWRSCNPPKEGQGNECSYATADRDENQEIIFKEDSGKIRWLTDTNECEWVGVICADTPNVVGIELLGQKLKGTLPTEITALPFLQILYLSLNELTGTIPEVYGEIRHLISLELHFNELTGTIPDSLYSHNGKSLINFNIGANLITGTVSTEIGNLRDAKGIHLFDNHLSGTIPSEIGNIEFLGYTRWSNNTFTGTLPAELSSLRYMNEFRFQDNFLTGTLPSNLNAMTRLTDFRVDTNRLTGTIPEGIYDMNRLELLFLIANQFSGTISTRIGELSNMRFLGIGENEDIEGAIPTELVSLTGLRLVYLHLTKMMGDVPIELCEKRGVGRLEILQADCFPVDNPPNPCRCCTACCNRESKVCLTNELN